MINRFLRKKSNAPYLLIFPALVILVITLFFPLKELVEYSMQSWSFGRPEESMTYVGLDNFKEIFAAGSSFWHSLLLTIIYMVSSIVLQTVLGLSLANLFNKKFPGQAALISLLIIPTILMPVMTAMMWRIYLYPNGIVNYIISFLGFQVDWYGSAMALPAIIGIQVWQWTPFYIISIIAGMRTIPESLYEAANVDGANGWRKFSHITLPMLKPVLGVCITIRAMNLLREFDNVFIIYGGGPGSSTEVLGLSIYRAMFGSQQVGMAAALSLVMIVLSCVVCLTLIRFFKNNAYEV